ncbi:MAG TPA: DUF1385 domain-containing protein [Clostridia bacterium]
MTDKKEGSAPIRTMIGGQAVLEGLMMMGPAKTALAVRQSNGNIQLEYMPTGKAASKAASIPFLRGSVRLFRQMVIGVKALLRSADLLEEAEQKEIPDTEISGAVSQEAADEPKPGGSSNLAIYASAAVGILLGIGLFMLLPNLITSLIKRLTSLGSEKGFGSTLLLNLIEGAIRITLFVVYVALTSIQKDIRRVWMYHGAEHKTIACYEKGLPLTVENIRTFSTRHPRCGTAFLFVVMIVSILLFTFAGWYSGIVNILIRFALVPLVAGIAFEIIRWSGRHDNVLSRLVAMPGLAMQRLTTREPDDEMIEVAILAMEAVIPETPLQDEW